MPKLQKCATIFYANSEQRTANSEQRTANSEQRTANSEQRNRIFRYLIVAVVIFVAVSLSACGNAKIIDTNNENNNSNTNYNIVGEWVSITTTQGGYKVFQYLKFTIDKKVYYKNEAYTASGTRNDTLLTAGFRQLEYRASAYWDTTPNSVILTVYGENFTYQMNTDIEMNELSVDNFYITNSSANEGWHSGVAFLNGQTRMLFIPVGGVK